MTAMSEADIKAIMADVFKKLPPDDCVMLVDRGVYLSMLSPGQRMFYEIEQRINRG